MKHYGDITEIKGSEVPIVDVITGGSPCQDLSTAKHGREGLTGERSGLFMEQIRIIKELHDECRRTNQPIRPRVMVWENVIGAMSSNDGADFRAVLEETARIADRNAVIPRLAFGQNWTNAGTIMGDRWSIAWRVHDSKFWGVAQTRRRISLVADFGGQTAPETLFERANLPGSASPYGGQQEICSPAGRQDSANETREPIMIELGSTKHTIIRDGICVTLKARMGTGGENVNAVIRDEGIFRLSPLEVERLQGFPDNWTEIGNWIDSKGRVRKSADSQRYKALGNSIALPFWEWLAGRIVNQLKQGGVENPTMASLFDGIGGFPLVFSRCGCEPVWASEIEEFPIAVTKYHFPDGEPPKL